MAKRLTNFPGAERASRMSSSNQGPLTRSRAHATHSDVDKSTQDTPPAPDGAEEDDENLQEGVPHSDVFECSICLQTCVHPVKLPCSHIFCFLCVKGVAIQSKRCALCRQDIPIDFFNNPELLRREDLLKNTAYEGGYQWYYQGVNGWWQYDERTSEDIEEEYKKGEKSLEMLIAGFLYVVDFETMFQYRRNDPSRRRKIKRDLITIPDKKGIAGLKVASSGSMSPHRLDGDGGENVPCVVQSVSQAAGVYNTPVTQPSRSGRSPRAISPGPPHNTPEETPVDAPIQPSVDVPDLTSQMAGLNLQNNNSASATERPNIPRRATLPERPSRTRIQLNHSPPSSDDGDLE